jgi:hypothetical protein
MLAAGEVEANDTTKIVLDTGIFRLLIASRPRMAVVEKVLGYINRNLPARLVSTFSLWPEYVGLQRPPFRYGTDFPWFTRLQSLEDLDDALAGAFTALIEKYRDDQLLKPGAIRTLAERFLAEKVNRDIAAAQEIAEDIILMRGQEFIDKSIWDGLSDEITLLYSFDELLHHTRLLPIDNVDAMTAMFHSLEHTLRVFRHLPVYRFADSVVEYLHRVHSIAPDETSARARRTIANARKGLSELKATEFADCVALWASVQGIEGTDGLKPIRLLTFDGKNVRRLKPMLEVLAAPISRTSLLESFSRSGDLQPGRVVVLCDKSGLPKQDLDVRTAVTRELRSAARLARQLDVSSRALVWEQNRKPRDEAA